MVKPVLFFICLLLPVMVWAQRSDGCYKSIYSYTILSGANSNTENDFIKSYLQKQLFEGLIYECYAGAEYNYIIPKMKHPVHGKDSIINQHGRVSGEFIDTGTDKLLILYKAHNCVEYMYDGKHRCHKYEETDFYRTGKKKKIGDYNCEEWKPKLKKYSKISVWACPDIPSYVNPGLFSPTIKGGMVSVIAEQAERFDLVKIQKVHCSDEYKNIKCETTGGVYNMAQNLVVGQ